MKTHKDNSIPILLVIIAVAFIIAMLFIPGCASHRVSDKAWTIKNLSDSIEAERG